MAGFSGPWMASTSLLPWWMQVDAVSSRQLMNCSPVLRDGRSTSEVERVRDWGVGGGSSNLSEFNRAPIYKRVLI